MSLTKEERKAAAEAARKWPKGEPGERWYVGHIHTGNMKDVIKVIKEKQG